MSFSSVSAKPAKAAPNRKVLMVCSVSVAQGEAVQITASLEVRNPPRFGQSMKHPPRENERLGRNLEIGSVLFFKLKNPGNGFNFFHQTQSETFGFFFRGASGFVNVNGGRTRLTKKKIMPICSMYGIFTYMWLKVMEKYRKLIHGS